MAVSLLPGVSLTASATTPHTHDDITFDKWTATGGYISGGNYYLTDNLTATGNITIDSGADVTLCLNGKTLDLGSYNIHVEGTLNIYDCSDAKEGYLISSAGSTNGVIYSRSGAVNVYGGNIINNGNSGYGIYNNGGTLTTQNCVIKATQTGSTGVSSSSGSSKTLAINEGTQISGVEHGLFTSGPTIMNGGTVTSTNGYGIYIDYQDVFTLSGGTVISANSYAIRSNGGIIYLSGAPVISGNDESYADIYVWNGEYFAERNDATPIAYSGEKLTIEVSYPSDGKVIIKNVSNDNKGKFELANTVGYTLEQSGDNLVLAKTHEHSWSTDWSSDSTHHWHECTADGCDVTDNTQKDDYAEHSFTDGFCVCGVHKHTDGTIYNNIITAEDDKIYVNGTEAVYESDMYNLPAGNYCLAENIDTDTIINASAEIDLCLCGYTLSSELRMSGGGTINDCTDNGSITNFWGFIGDITLNGGTIISGIGVGNNETFTVNGGTVDGLINIGYNAMLILNDGKLTNSGESYVVSIVDGTVKINGGEVENDGTGIFSYCGKLHITGGSIKSTASSAIINYSGRVYLSGSPVIEGYETGCADIEHDYSRFESVYAHSYDGSTAYSGSALTFMFAAQGDYADGNLAIAGVDPTTENLFTLLGNENYKLVRGTGGNADNLVLAFIHTHSWEYSGDGAKITASCVGAGTCDYAGADKELTISAPAKTTYGDADSENATLSGETFAGQASLPTIKYAGREGTTYAESETAPTNAGKYTAKITVDTATASVDYEIAKAAPSYTVPTGLAATYGQTLANVTLPTGFTWQDAATTSVGSIGTNTFKVTFTPTDTTNYEIVADIDVAIDVTRRSSGGGGVTRYTVKFDTDGGSTVKSATVNRNSKVAEPDEPAKDGYVFDGWYTDKELTEKYDFENKITKSFTLYAKWTEIEKEPDEDENTGVRKWNPFIDVTENDWFHDVIKEAYLNGLVTGTTDTTFTPDGNITRGMFVTILWRAEGEPAVNKSIPFADVKATDYYANAVIWAQQHEIVKGISEIEFAPDSNITREQMAAILYRYALYKGVTPATTLAYHLGKFTDKDKISEYAVTALDWAVSGNIISGKGDGILDPLGNATRAEATAVLVRFLDIIK